MKRVLKDLAKKGETKVILMKQEQFPKLCKICTKGIRISKRSRNKNTSSPLAGQREGKMASLQFLISELVYSADNFEIDFQQMGTRKALTSRNYGWDFQAKISGTLFGFPHTLLLVFTSPAVEGAGKTEPLTLVLIRLLT